MKIPSVKALTFDVGDTVFDWRGAIETDIQHIPMRRGRVLTLDSLLRTGG
jgi:FMN phosphatase YigB (HAD superfamily)